MSIRRAIVEAIYYENGCWDVIDPQDIRGVEFRKGLAEIEVSYHIDLDDDTTDIGHAVIDAAPVLSQLLQWAMNTEVV